MADFVVGLVVANVTAVLGSIPKFAKSGIGQLGIAQ